MKTVWTRPARLRVAGGVLGLTLTLGAAPIAASAFDQRAEHCGAWNPTNVVVSEFDIAAAREIWKYFPAMGMAPDLAASESPMHVVVFRDGFDSTGVSVRASVSKLNGVVCVITSSDEVTIFTDVSMSGAIIP